MRYLQKHYYVCFTFRRLRTVFYLLIISLSIVTLSHEINRLRHAMFSQNKGETFSVPSSFCRTKGLLDNVTTKGDISHLIISNEYVPIPGKETPQSTPLIKFYKHIPAWFPDIKKTFSSCKNRCLIDLDPTSFEENDIIVFHGPTLRSGKPPKKLRNQVWVLHALEAPPRIPEAATSAAWNGRFNWTISYRRDADILDAVATISKVEKPFNPFNLSSSILSAKTGLMAWLVTNCNTPSKREKYVQQLAQYVPLVMNPTCIGKVKGRINAAKHICGNSYKLTNDGCLRAITKNASFYLSFENSHCVDYITEKSFKIFNHSIDVIPVTRMYKNLPAMYLPPESYIDSNQFSSPMRLSNFLLDFRTSESGFNKYFDWKARYKIAVNVDNSKTNAFCSLCDRVHETNWRQKYKRLYESVDTWVRGTSKHPMCSDPH